MGVFASAGTSIEDQHFFELAATIIPIILFGSVLANALRPPDDDEKTGLLHGVGAIVFSLYMAAMASAEILAIAGAVSSGLPNAVLVFVAVALTVEILLFGAMLLVPWALRFRREGQDHWLLGTALGLFFLVLFGWGSFFFLEYAVVGSHSGDDYDDAVRRSQMVDLTYLQWSRAAVRAHDDHEISPLERQQLAVLRRRKQEAWREQLDSGYSVPPIRYAR